MTKINFPEIDAVAPIAHQKYVETRRSQGVSSEKLDDSGEETLVDYTSLSETAKGLVRTEVQAVFQAIEHHGPTSFNSKEIEQVCNTAHDRWMEARRSEGATSEVLDDTKEELMKPYSSLSENAKNLTRAVVKATIVEVSQSNPTGGKTQTGGASNS